MLGVDGEDSFALALVDHVEPAVLDGGPGPGQPEEGVEHQRLLHHRVGGEVAPLLVQQAVIQLREVRDLDL